MGISVQGLSGATNGLGIKISATTAGGANTLHTAVNATNAFDAVEIYANNSDTTADRLLTFTVGGTTDPDNLIKWTVPKGSQGGLLDGERFGLTLLLWGGTVLGAFCDVTNKVICYGKVIRKT